MSLKKSKTLFLLRWLDAYLTSPKHWWIAVGIVSGVYWAIFSRGKDITNPIFFAVMTVWLYTSSRKYGFLDTVMFLAALPFMFLSAIISLAGARRPSPHALTPQELKDFALTATEEVHTAINTIYAGKIIDSRIEESGVYVLEETPFGLRVPEKELISGVAKGLSISPSHILFDPVSENRHYYVFGPEAVQEYLKEKYSVLPLMTFAGIRDRVLCTSPLRPSRQSPRG